MKNSRGVQAEAKKQLPGTAGGLSDFIASAE